MLLNSPTATILIPPIDIKRKSVVKCSFMDVIMGEFFDLASERFSVRKFSAREVEAEKIGFLLVR